ncbi:MAG: LptF/LptG family permease [bacterium]
MKIVTRYILKQLVLPFLVALFLFTTVLLLVELFNLTDLIINKGVPLFGILLVLAAQIPESFTFTVPMALIMSVVMTYGRLSQDNEITALRMAGYSLQSLIIPPLVVGGVLSVLLVGMHQYGLPQLTNYKEQTLAELQLVNPVGLLQPNTYLEIPPYTLYAEEVDGKTMKNVWIEDRSQANPQIIVSRKGRWIKQGEGLYQLVLTDGTLHQQGDETSYRVLKFKEQILKFQPQQNQRATGKQGSARTLFQKYLTYKKLGEQWENAKSSSSKALKRARKRFLEHAVDFHRNLALPLATFFLVLLTAPAGMLTKNFGKLADLIICLGTFVVYYLGLSLMEPLAMTGYCYPWVAMWLPNFAFGLMGLGAIVYLKRTGG